MSSILDWDTYFMAVAFLAAKKSKDPVTRVGACIVNPDNVIVGVGFNKMPRKCSNEFSWKKFDKDPLNNKYLYVCHAAMNAMINKNTMDIKGFTMYISLFPCNNCAKYIIENGIKEIVYLSDKYKGEKETIASRRMLQLAGVKLTQFKPTKMIIEINFSDINAVSMEQ